MSSQHNLSHHQFEMFLTPEEIKRRGVDERELHEEDDGSADNMWDRKAEESEHWEEHGSTDSHSLFADVRKHGVQRPVVLDTRYPHNIIDGHHRVASARPGSLIPVTYEKKWWDDDPHPKIVY